MLRENVFLSPSIPEQNQFFPDMEGKRVLINGGSMGIGLAVAELCEIQGADVTVVSRNGANIPFKQIQADLTTEAGVNSTFTLAGSTDYIFNNIGQYYKGEIADTGFNKWREIMKNNLDAMFLLTKASMEAVNDDGVIVNMASRPSLEKYHSWSAYTLAKQGVITLTRAAAEESAYKGVSAYSICPSRVNTSFRDEVFPDEDKNTRLSPGETAEAIMYLFNGTLPNGEAYWIKKI